MKKSTIDRMVDMVNAHNVVRFKPNKQTVTNSGIDRMVKMVNKHNARDYKSDQLIAAAIRGVADEYFRNNPDVLGETRKNITGVVIADYLGSRSTSLDLLEIENALKYEDACFAIIEVVLGALQGNSEEVVDRVVKEVLACDELFELHGAGGTIQEPVLGIIKRVL